MSGKNPEKVLEKIKIEYIAGGISQRKLSEKYGVSRHQIRRAAQAEKWGELRKEAAERANEEIVKTVATVQAERAEKLFNSAEALLDKLNEIIKELTLAEVVVDQKALKSLTGGLRDIAAILGIKSSLDAEEQKLRIDKMKKEMEEDPSSKEIKVVILGEAEEFSE